MKVNYSLLIHGYSEEVEVMLAEKRRVTKESREAEILREIEVLMSAHRNDRNNRYVDDLYYLNQERAQIIQKAGKKLFQRFKVLKTG